MTNSEALIQRRDAVVPRGVGRLNGIVAASARGAVLTDVDGREYIDLATGIGVMTAGHGQAEVLAAATAQLQALQHACFHVATYEPYVALCEKLTSLVPHGERTKAMLVNTGAEAVENAIKIARQATGRPAVLCYTEAFHGRTLLGMTLTSKVSYKVGCGPYAPEVYRLPYPNRWLHGDGLSDSAFLARELERLEDTLVHTVPASQVAAILIEIVQGEGGFSVCPPEYLRGLRKLCDQHGILLIADEVQTGLCRTGRWAAHHHAGVVPDLSTWAKALGGGLPIGAVVGRAEVMDKALPGTIGGTFGGNPVACASALATLELMEREGLCARATALGARIRTRLLSLQEGCPLVGEVRGLGAMQAFELVHGGDPRRPATAVAERSILGAIARGVLVIAAGANRNVLRLLPPLCITDAEIDRALDLLAEAVLEAAQPLP